MGMIFIYIRIEKTAKPTSQDTTEPTQGVFNFGPGDEVVAEAQKNGQLMRGGPSFYSFLLLAYS